MPRPVVLALALTASLLGPDSALPAQKPDSGDRVRREGRWIVLELKPESFSILRDPDAWIAELDRAYEAFADLVGGRPFRGRKQRIREMDEDPGGWAVAGQPIKWHPDWVARSLEKVNRGDVLFGILHEMGHNFDLEGKWVWEAEFWANFKMAYALETCRLTVQAGPFRCDYADPEGKRLEDQFAELHRRTTGARPGEQAHPVLDWYRHGCSSMHFFLDVKNRIGWAPFKQTFRDYRKIAKNRIPKDPESKLSLFLHMLSRNTRADLWSLFQSWGYPLIRPVGYRAAMSGTKFAQALCRHDSLLGALRVLPARGRPGAPVPLRVEVAPARESLYGLMTGAESRIVYRLNRRYRKLGGVAFPGGRKGVCFQARVDGRPVWDSGTLDRGTGGRAFKVSVAGGRKLELIVTRREPMKKRAPACWADTWLADSQGRRTYLDDLDPVAVEHARKALETRRTRRRPLTFRYPRFPKKPLIVRLSLDGPPVKLRRSAEPGVYIGETVASAPGRYDGLLQATYEQCTLTRLFPEIVQLTVTGKTGTDTLSRN